ncbi:MAG: three-Cys-motif partner protein TcmP [Candidatus Binatia bacterium]
MARRTKRGGSEPRFGGDWTERKLDIVASYLRAYTTALRNTTFEKLYVDAFAGTGYRGARREDEGAPTTSALLLPDLAHAEPQALLEGSARRALATDPRFDRYVFIERGANRCAQLEKLRTDFPAFAGSIEIRQGEANAEIQSLCAGDWRTRRAVLFLDPYGMQVEWATIEAIARTQAIDLWILFPLGIGVNRLLTKSGDIPGPWRRRLDLLLGTGDWYDEFYAIETSPTLFGGEEERVVKASTATIGKYFLRRLESVFAGIAPAPAVLRNSRKVPLYLLCFAVGNARGRDIALRIANHLLKEVS